MKISYSILVHNEDETFEKLLHRLIEYKQPQDEIVVLDDYSDNPKTRAVLDYYHSAGYIELDTRHLAKDFASQKNYLKKNQSLECSNEKNPNQSPSRTFLLELKKYLLPNLKFYL